MITVGFVSRNVFKKAMSKEIEIMTINFFCMINFFDLNEVIATY